MALRLNSRGGFLHWTLEIPAWTILIALLLVPVAAFLIGRMAISLATNDAEEDIPLSRNEVVADGTGNRIWYGAFQNASGSEDREVAVTIRFLDNNNVPVGEVRGQVERLSPGESLPLQGPLPKTAARMQVYSVQRRTGPDNLGRLLGPYRPWEFGVLQNPEKHDFGKR